jgi:GGDEF domain-containing protein
VVAERLLDALSAPIVLGGDEVSITCSIGVTELGRSEVPEAILDRSDAAMRIAKAQGRNRWVALPPPLP